MLRILFCASCAIACAPIVAHAIQLNEGDSPSGAIHYAVRGPDGEKRIFLAPKDQRQYEVELCESPGWGNLQLHFSPDDSWIIVQDGGSSLGVSLRLFKREQGVQFKELEASNIDGKAEMLALKENGLPEKEVLDHRYASVLAWSADSQTVLIRVSGHGGDDKVRVRITGWQGLYDLATGEFSFDLARLNRKGAQIEKRKVE